MVDFRRLRTDLLALAVMAVVAFIGLSLATFDPADPPASHIFPARETVRNWAGPVGADVAYRLHYGLGAGAWFLLAAIAVWDMRLFARHGDDDAVLRALGTSLAVVGVCAALHRFAPDLGDPSPYGNGGYVGAVAISLLEPHFRPLGIFLIASSLFLAGLVFADELTTLTWGLRVALFPVTIWNQLAFAGAAENASPATSSDSESSVSPQTPAAGFTTSANRELVVGNALLAGRDAPIPIRAPAPWTPSDSPPQVAPPRPVSFSNPVAVAPASFHRQPPVTAPIMPSAPAAPTVPVATPVFSGHSDEPESPFDLVRRSSRRFVPASIPLVSDDDFSDAGSSAGVTSTLSPAPATPIIDDTPPAPEVLVYVESGRDAVQVFPPRPPVVKPTSLLSPLMSWAMPRTSTSDEARNPSPNATTNSPASLSLLDLDDDPIVLPAVESEGDVVPFRLAIHESSRDPQPVAQPAPFVPSSNIIINGPDQSHGIVPAAELAPAHDPVVEVMLPTSDLLESPEAFPYEALASRAQTMAVTIETAFHQFGLKVRVVAIDTGPVITQFELELEPGLRLAKVAALADDLAIALRVPSVRVVAPIPGRNTVGIEVPNAIRVTVRLRELLESCRNDFAAKQIPLFLGKDVSGKPLVVDLCKMPHLLIAGRTGTGKSVCLNTLILSILMARRPDQVKLIMIDPKMVELSPYTRIPHLMHPVITDMRKAEAVLGWAVDEMEQRYDLLARVGVRHLDSYNKLGKAAVLKKLGLDPASDEAAAVPETMPFIVIIADEMADMMMTSGKDVEGHIIRLAQKSRAVGIHLVLATQKPTVDVITGLIKSNLPARISFQVASKTDSRVVLDEGGADKLLGNGDMLYLASGTSTLTRAQGTYVSDDEVNRLIDYYAPYEPQYCPELVKLKPAPSKTANGDVGPDAAAAKADPLYQQAIETVLREGRGSTSLLQRALGVGYGRAAKMIDRMADDGIVGEFNGGQARDVLMTLDEWESSRE